MAKIKTDERIQNFRDLMIVLVGTFMLIYDTVFASTPSPLIIGGGLTCFGLPIAFRLDVPLRRKDNENP